MALNFGNILGALGSGAQGYQQAQNNNAVLQNNQLANQQALQNQQASQLANSVLGNLFSGASSGAGFSGPAAPVIPNNIGINQPIQQQSAPQIPASLGSIMPQSGGGNAPPPPVGQQQAPATGGPVNLYQGPGQPSVPMGQPQPAASGNATPQNLPGQQFAKSPSQALATPSAQSSPLSNMDMQQLPGMLAKEINKIPNITPQQKGAAFIMALTKLQPMIQAQQSQQMKEQQLKLAQDRLGEKEQYDNQMMDIRGRLADIAGQKATQKNTSGLSDAATMDSALFYNATKTFPGGGYGMSQAEKDSIKNLAAKIQSPDYNPADAKATNKADTASLTNIQKMTDSAEAYENTMIKNMGVVNKLMDKGAGTSEGTILNRWLQAGRRATGDPDVAAFDAAIKTVTTEAAKIQSGSMGNQALTDSARAEAEGIVNKFDSPEAIKSSFAVLRQDADNKKNEYGEQIKTIRSRISNKPKTESKDKVKSHPLPPEMKDVPDGTTVPDSDGTVWMKQGNSLVPAEE